MGRKIKPERYARINLEGDPPERTHHAVIFNNGPSPKHFSVRCRLPRLLTWTPTRHGTICNWDVVASRRSEQLLENEFALLVPRSWWLWWLPFVPNKTKATLFYLKPEYSPVVVKHII